MNTDEVRQSYDAVADEYAARIADELRHKPLDRTLLAEVAEEARGRGPVCDLGCGPGHVARYLHDLGVEVRGIDLSPGLIVQARTLNPDIHFSLGDIRSLDVPDEAFAAVVAFYSLIHFEREELRPALAEIRRVLIPGGLLLAAFHRGSETRHLEEWWGREVRLDFVFFEPQQVESALAETGFATERVVQRPPYAGVEAETNRFYVFARAPSSRGPAPWRRTPRRDRAHR